jgi:hypothetical protein
LNQYLRNTSIGTTVKQRTKIFCYVSTHLRSHINNSSSCLTGISKHLKTCFLVFGYPGETLALVVHILHQKPYLAHLACLTCYVTMPTTPRPNFELVVYQCWKMSSSASSTAAKKCLTKCLCRKFLLSYSIY